LHLNKLQAQNTKYEKAAAELLLFQEKDQTLTQKREHADAKLDEMKRLLKPPQTHTIS
jgi:hypothetical protein